ELLFQRPTRLPALGQLRDQQETGVVPRLRVLRARISQSHDEMQILHARESGPAGAGPSKLFLLLGGRRGGFLVASRSSSSALLGSSAFRSAFFRRSSGAFFAFLLLFDH